MKHYQSIAALCPFYHKEDKMKVYCEGVEDGISTHVAFASGKQAEDFKWRYCRCNYQDCPYYIMLLAGYNIRGEA